VRQSTADQLLHNHESRRRQYGLAERARQLGWSEVVVIDDDLGRSGGGVNRPGFERLLAAICEGRVGAVLAVEASRLARNGRDWHTLLEFCGLVGCLIADEDGLYDPRLPNDRLLLGMKGTMSEMELSILRQRSFEALRQKARRGELFLNVAVGFVKRRHDRIERDPDLRVREAIALVFRKFAEFQSVRQVHLWLRQEAITLPAVEYGPEGSRIVWKPPVYNTVHHMLTNPVYAGAYAFGRTGNRVTLEGGRKRVVRGIRREPSDWHVLLPEHHEAYITWAEWEGNQRLIADNANSTGLRARGSVRRGEALAGWPAPVRALRAPSARRLQRRERRLCALSLSGRTHQSRHATLYFVWGAARRSGGERRSAAGAAAARDRGRAAGDRCACGRGRRDSSAG
jgi:DNA invertase Pin-like site-specific DNA recombinase